MNWNIINNKLEKEFKLKSFSEIIEKLQSLSKIADELNHHPDFRVQNYNTILFTLCTHDKENTITRKDYELAEKIDLLFEKQ